MRLIILFILYFTLPLSTIASVETVRQELENSPLGLALNLSCVNGEQMLTVSYINKLAERILLPQRAVVPSVYKGAFLRLNIVGTDEHLSNVIGLKRKGRYLYDLPDLVPVDANATKDMLINLGDFYPLIEGTKYAVSFDLTMNVHSVSGKGLLATDMKYLVFTYYGCAI